MNRFFGSIRGTEKWISNPKNDDINLWVDGQDLGVWVHMYFNKDTKEEIVRVLVTSQSGSMDRTKCMGDRSQQHIYFKGVDNGARQLD